MKKLFLNNDVFGFCSCQKEGTQTNASLPEVDLAQAIGKVGEIILIQCP